MRAGWIAAVVMLAACETNDGQLPDAPAALIDAPAADAPTPWSCTQPMPRQPPTPPACLALATSSLQGTTPLGNLDVALTYFGAGDCITISHAWIGWVGECGEEVSLQFSYPVKSDATHRFVDTSFDDEARLSLAPPNEAPRSILTNIHVDVTTWQEGSGTHTIDIVVTFTAPGFAVAPMRIQGTFCDWPYYLC